MVGDLENIKNLWDQYTLGAVPCEGEAIELSEHPTIAPYLEDIAALKAAGDWDPEPLEALRPFGEPRPVCGPGTGELPGDPGRDGGDYPGV